MTCEAATGESSSISEDTIDLGDRLDAVRTLLRRVAGGDRLAAGALFDVLGPRIHGLAVHVTGSASRAERLTVSVLRECLRDAAELAASTLSGEAAVLDRARRAVLRTRRTGDVRSLASPAAANDRTRDHREIEVLRVLLALAPAQRALVESAAQGRFEVTGAERPGAAAELARVLDRIVPLDGPEDEELRALAALDALALAGPAERQRLAELAGTAPAAELRRRAVEATARLTLLTALPASRDLHVAVLEGFPAATAGAGTAGASELGTEPEEVQTPVPEAEAAYGGDYATPVLGTDAQRRMVGPPARPGAPSAPTASPEAAPAPGSRASPRPGPSPGTAPPPVPTPGARADSPSSGPDAADVSGPPSFAFRPGDEAERSRRARRRERARARAGGRPVPWISRALAAVLAVLVLVLGGLLLDARGRLAEAERFTDTWATLSLSTGAQHVPGLSDNGTWEAVIAAEGIALRAEGVAGWDGEVLELWGRDDGVTRSLGVLDLARDGDVTFTSTETAESLLVTREIAPGSGSGSPSSRVVATLDPDLSVP